VGEASAEMKISDSVTGEVLGAFADRRVGKKRLDADSFDSWDDVKQTLEYWTDLARYRLYQERHAKDGQARNCVPPES
jgi:hypothetical protein